jgi:hypothetical protein
MTVRAQVCGVGHYLPSRVVENSEFEATLETSDEWIRSRSGIERRHFAAEDETTSQMAAHAARAALKDAGLGVHVIVRDWDRLTWPYTTAGFFKVKKKIPHILDGLNQGRLL